MLVDTHAHLDFPEFKGDRDAVVQRALESGVSRILAVGVDLPSSRAVVVLAEKYDSVSAAVGVHPGDASKWNDSVAKQLATLAQHPKVVAIGEIGLDYYRDRSPRELQRQAFQGQLDLAASLGLPVIVHDREAHQQTLMALRSWATRPDVRGNQDYATNGLGVLHCFSGDLALAEQLLALGFCISIAGPVTYPKSGQLGYLARKLPLSGLVIETDCPYLTPQAWRGRRNEPAYVRAVAEKIAELRSVALETVAEATTANARRLFRLP